MKDRCPQMSSRRRGARMPDSSPGNGFLGHPPILPGGVMPLALEGPVPYRIPYLKSRDWNGEGGLSGSTESTLFPPIRSLRLVC